MSLPSVYIDPALSSLAPRETPFEQVGRCTNDRWFLYMTNRSAGRWSYLMTEADTRKRFEEYAPMGYTQLWLLKKVFASGPVNGKSAATEKGQRRSFQPPYPKSLDRNNWPGRLHVVLREPIALQYPKGDVVGYRIDPESAIRRAENYTRTYGRRAVVGLMVWDATWH